MRNRTMSGLLIRAFFSATAIVAVTSNTASAAMRSCGFPVSDGDRPTATDALFILDAAVQPDPCGRDGLWTCDVDGNCQISASDALFTLNVAVGLFDTDALGCDCTEISTTTFRHPATTYTTTTSSSTSTTSSSTTTTTLPPASACDDIRFHFSVATSDVDNGWNGLGHNLNTASGIEIGLDVVRRCSDSRETCELDADCANGQTCRPTCACDASASGPACELTAKDAPTRCIGDMSMPCDNDADCDTAGLRCVTFVGPPQPMTFPTGIPLCVTRYLQDGALDATFDASSGESGLDTVIRSILYLGINIDRPCPQCGTPEDDPEVGDVLTCRGLPNDGLPCTVEAVSETFGGISSDCPPNPPSNVSGTGVATPIDATTGTRERTAQLPCGFPLSQLHPAGGGQLNCLDDFEICTSNEDCSPGVTCGMYCHCGFCELEDAGGYDPEQPCWEDSDCESGSCWSATSDQALNQEKPNACEGLRCGVVEKETCCTVEDGQACPEPTATIGVCDVIPAGCINNNDCLGQNNGTVCELAPRACFDTTISRTGAPSRGSGRCAAVQGTPACAIDEDCAEGTCSKEQWSPVLAAVTCTSSSGSLLVNGTTGRPGPVAMTLDARVSMCDCAEPTTSANCAAVCPAGSEE